MRAISIAVSLLVTNAAPSATDPARVMEEVNLQASPVDETVEIEMVLHDKDGKTRRRTATLFARRREPGDWPSLRMIRFHTPPEMAKSAVLITERKDGENQQWIYLPATYTTRQIPSQKRSDRYMGTDYSYEDASSAKVEQYAYRLLRKETVSGVECLVIEQVPIEEKLKRESAYARAVLWVDPATRVLVRAEYEGRDGKVAKIFTASKVRRYGDHFRPDHTEMEDVTFRHRTVIDYHGRQLKTGLQSEFFSIRNLERATR